MLRILGKPKQGWDLKIPKQECKSSNTRLGNTYFSHALKKIPKYRRHLSS